MKKNNYTLGLDIGIASVGWGIVDSDNYKIIDSGVRLFQEGTAALNETRREMRSSRRLIRRRHHRLKRMKTLLEDNGIIDSNFKHCENPYEIRVKGLREKLSNDELATAILHITKRRGVTGVQAVDDKEGNDNELSTKKVLADNEKELKNKYICEIQLERLKNGKVRDNTNRFSGDDYVNELKAIFKNQDLNKKLKDDIINIVTSKREYYDGPGSEKSPTIYGQYFVENGELVHIDMIEKMRGHCSIYPEELRAPKMSYTANLFNLLNDLNNLSINGNEKIDKEVKKMIINDYINVKGNITVKQLAKLLNVTDEEITGFRVSKSGTPLLTEFAGYKKILKCIKDNKLKEEITDNKELVDKIIEVLTNKKGFDERKDSLIALGLSDRESSCFASITGISGYHSLSKKVMNEIIPDLIETNMNQMKLFAENGYFSHKSKELEGTTLKADATAILSPVVKRSQNEAMKIIRTAIKKYGNFESIVIEMPRDKNSEKEKERIKAEQKYGEDLNNQIKDIVNNEKISSDVRLKVRLWLEQDGKCMYTGKEIKINDILTDSRMYEVDHIIPLSISFDDSYQNKVLVTSKSNSDKNQRTPYEYFKLGMGEISYEQYKNNVLNLYSNKKIKRKKKDNLLYEKDLNKFENQQDFIQRNLVDTQYSSRVVLNTLQNYFKANNIDTKVHVVRGAITSMFRKKARIEKDRNSDYKHHAVDALIIASIKKMNLFNNVLNASLYKDEVYDAKTGEIITNANEKDFYDTKFLEFVGNLKSLETKYSHKIDTKPNRGISDQTIYSTRKDKDDNDIIIRKYNIYEDAGEKLAKLFRDGNATSLLMYENDKESYDLLESVCNAYPTEKNPFLAYKNEANDYIRKKCKKGKGPAIKKVKYKDKKLGYCVDISTKYNVIDKKVVLASKNPYRVDIYQEPDGSYKFLRICHDNIKSNNNGYFIEKNDYNKEKKERKISDDACFKFSLYKNDLFYYEKDDEKNIVRYNGTMYNTNSFEYKNVFNNENLKGSIQDYITIGKKIIKLEKRGTDVLGNIYKIDNEPCKFNL